jgi:hypothetical protein
MFGEIYGIFRTCVGVAAKSLSLIPKLLSTADPVGKP